MIHGVGTIGHNVAAAGIGNIAIVDKAQTVGIERVLVLHDERQIGAGQAQMPNGAASRLASQSFKRAVGACGDGGLVDFRAGFRSGRATVAHVWRRRGIRELGHTPAVVVDLGQFAEILDIALTQHGVKAQVEPCRRVSQ